MKGSPSEIILKLTHYYVVSTFKYRPWEAQHMQRSRTRYVRNVIT